METPRELRYICRDDWSQDLIIEYLCQKSFSVPAKEHSSAVQLIQVTPYRASSSASSSSSTDAGSINKDGVLLPRAYRVPLMFVAKFQWESLRLVLTSANPKEEWEEYKFDIVHISRLCQHLFEQAREAAKKALAVNPSGISIIGSNRSGSVGKGVKGGSSLLELGVGAGPGAGPGASALGMKRVHTAVEGVFDKTWRSPMFDRVLTRFYRKWFVSREWSLKNFYEEFDEEEYEIDVLKYDWARWAIKGHKGFILTKEEVQGGITAEQYMRGLGKTKEGVWTWVTPSLIPTISPPMAIASNTASNAVNGSSASGGVSTTTANANAISTTVASAPQFLAQAEQAGSAPSAPITPTIPTSTTAGIPGSAVTNSTTSAETASGTGTEAASDAPPSFSTVQVKREHLENKVLRQEGAGAAKEREKSKDGNGDRELSDEFAMITHPSHSDPQPPPPAIPASSASKQKTTTTTEPRPSTSTATSSTSSTPVTTLPEKVIGKKRKRPREEVPPIIAESVSAAPVQKQRRTIQTARKSMSVIHVQRSHREQMMRDKINTQISALRAQGHKKVEKEDVSESASSNSSSPSSSSSEEDDERDEDYKVRPKPKTTGAGVGKTKPSPVACCCCVCVCFGCYWGNCSEEEKFDEWREYQCEWDW
ncbi:hypothetical protein CPB84DRAFT_1538165 [Gymnopilus junonius]|uniref:Uncharacterized protein n=1 Tax=Gymnopilus junonius TaxID=109634 RepID=A0A9P5NJB5_GYMJU|nr:hypothetical protein CPB84DRAFT_1538165 [Gymnopilus junonius]